MSTPVAGPFALGTFSQGDSRRFPGLLVNDAVLDLRLEPGLWQAGEAPSVRLLLERWDASLRHLSELAGHPGGTGWFPRSSLRVHPPVEPRQIFQAGANYPPTSSS